MSALLQPGICAIAFVALAACSANHKTDNPPPPLGECNGTSQVRCGSPVSSGATPKSSAEAGAGDAGLADAGSGDADAGDAADAASDVDFTALPDF